MYDFDEYINALMTAKQKAVLQQRLDDIKSGKIKIVIPEDIEQVPIISNTCNQPMT